MQTNRDRRDLGFGSLSTVAHPPKTALEFDYGVFSLLAHEWENYFHTTYLEYYK